MISLSLVGCASSRGRSKKDAQLTYLYKDTSGEFMIRERDRWGKGKLLRDRSLLTVGDEGPEIVETGRLLGKFVGDGSNQSYRPRASSYTAWMEGKKWSTQMKFSGDSVAVRWNKAGKGGELDFQIPPGIKLCFYQLMDQCVHRFADLKGATPIGIYVLWQSYPFQGEFFDGLPTGPFLQGTIQRDFERTDRVRFEVTLAGQSLYYDYDKKGRFLGHFWTQQGVSKRPTRGN